jgi:hypothetical protein
MNARSGAPVQSIRTRPADLTVSSPEEINAEINTLVDYLKSIQKR